MDRRAVGGLTFVLLVGGCAQLFGLDEIQQLPAMPCVADTFDTLDTTRWDIGTPANINPHVAVADGTVVIDVAAGDPNPDAYNELSSRNSYDLRGFTLYVQLLGFTTEQGAETMFGVETSGTALYAMVAHDVLRLKNGNDADTFETTLIEARDVWFRIRHDAVASQLVLDTSPELGNWKERARIPAPAIPPAMHPFLQAGSYQAVTTAQRATFDNVRLDAPSCQP